MLIYLKQPLGFYFHHLIATLGSYISSGHKSMGDQLHSAIYTHSEHVLCFKWGVVICFLFLVLWVFFFFCSLCDFGLTKSISQYLWFSSPWIPRKYLACLVFYWFKHLHCNLLSIGIWKDAYKSVLLGSLFVYFAEQLSYCSFQRRSNQLGKESF